MKVRAHSIDWDTDGHDPRDLDLPSEVIIDLAAEDIEDPQMELADWLSDRYGWCVNGFLHEPVADVSNGS